jgi:hypothetical protein
MDKNYLVQLERISRKIRSLVSSHCFLLVSFCISDALLSTVHASADIKWETACVDGLEKTGGLGSNAARPYCGCMLKAATKFNGDTAGLLSVMEATREGKSAAYAQQGNINKQIISACVARVEEVYGAAIEAKSAEQRSSEEQPQPRGIWADSQVTQAILAINMDSDQAKVFRQAATKYSNNLRTAAAKIFREKLDIKRKLKKKQRVLAKRMDKQVTAVLAERQRPAYEAFSAIFSQRTKALARR